MNGEIFCQNCGTVNGYESTYCTNCGLVIDSKQQQQQPMGYIQQPQPRSSKTMWIIIGIIFAASCLPGIVSIIYYAISASIFG